MKTVRVGQWPAAHVGAMRRATCACSNASKPGGDGDGGGDGGCGG